MFWSRKLLDNGTTSAGAAKDTITTVPAALNTRGSFLVRVESDLDYKPVITWAATDRQSLGLAAIIRPHQDARSLLPAAAHELAGDLLRLLNGQAQPVLHSDENRGGSI